MPAALAPTIFLGNGGRVLEREQRRLAAIVAADVVGYSRLMGRDESGTLARLRKNRAERLDPVLARYGGRLVKLTGDGALVEFGSAVDALGAAITFQQAMAEANEGQPADTALMFRMGLHLGDLIVDGDDFYGDGVNVAARLESEAPTGGIAISGAVHEAVAGRVKASFEDLGKLSLKNIERPVQAFSMRWQAADWPLRAAADAVPSPLVARPSTPLPLPDKPSIAVLPFQNMSGDPEQEFFTDGIVEDVITELSRFRELFVIARNSSFAYKGKSVDIKEVGRELGVRYVLEGSIRRSAGRIRVTAQLIEAGTGAHLWAERYDRVLEDIFAVQEEVTRAIVSALAPEIAATEHTRAMRRRPEDVSAYEIALRAWSDVLDAHQAADLNVMKRAVEGANKALVLDPNSVLAWQSLCFARQLEVWHRAADKHDESYREAQEAADRAIALDGADARKPCTPSTLSLCRKGLRATAGCAGRSRAGSCDESQRHVRSLSARQSRSVGRRCRAGHRTLPSILSAQPARQPNTHDLHLVGVRLCRGKALGRRGRVGRAQRERRATKLAPVIPT
jgi:TolB-like protein/class 3 adenylate cyclase